MIGWRTVASALAAWLAIASGTGGEAGAQPAPLSGPIAPNGFTRTDDLLAILNGGGDVDALFAESFLAQVPEAKLREILAQLSTQFGTAHAFAPDPSSPGLWHVTYDRGTVAMRIAADPDGERRITGLLVTGADAPEADLAALKAALAALHGRTAFALAELGDGPPRLLDGLAPTAPLAIGSTFKLVILATIVQDVNAGRHRWDEPVMLDVSPLPGGAFTAMPRGTTVPLRELAKAMISVSDNSAADILLHLLGRRHVEDMLPIVGIADPARDRPFLSTLEAFTLKAANGGTLARRWPMLDEDGRRDLLSNTVDLTPPSAIDESLFKTGPLHPDTIEWFASPLDLVRVMDWLRRNTAAGLGSEARAILSANPGIGPEVAGRFGWVGYKGGSEPGVISMTLLLQRKDGRWLALSAGWNDPRATVDEVRFVSLVARAAELSSAR